MGGKTQKPGRRLACLCAALLFALLLLPPVPARADTATDYLSVRVGYSGMDLSDYATAGKYHWRELEGLGTHQYAYSYYQSGSGTDYTAIVDSARGILVRDVLDLANINYGDIYNLKFYVEDHHGIQASFDRDSLFCTRYYFDDFAYHLERILDEDGNLTGYSYDEVWQYAQAVPPMLALEDSWIGYSQEFETIGPNWESMGSSNRFRLLFGQTSPTETLTSASAKYVSCIYVTLYGAPVFGEMPDLDSTLGSHEVTLQVRVDDESLKEALSEFMRLASSNENVMIVTGMTFTAVEGYSDLVNVTVTYEIIGEGEASMTASFGGSTTAVQVTKAAEIPPAGPEHPEEPEPPGGQEPPEGTEPGGSTEPSGEQEPPEGREPGDGTDPADKPPEEPQSGEPERQTDVPERDGSRERNERGKKEKPENGKVEEPAADRPPEEIPEEIPDRIDEAAAEAPEAEPDTAAAALGFRLSERKAAAVGANDPGTEAVAGLTPAAEDISQVKLEDMTEEEKERQRRFLLWTGACSAGICLLGAGAEAASFRSKLGRHSAGIRLISTGGKR